VFADSFLSSVCAGCGQAYVRSIVDFSTLPVVQLSLDSGLSDERAWHVLGSAISAEEEDDALAVHLGSEGTVFDENGVVSVDAKLLAVLRPEEVLVAAGRWWKCMLSELVLVSCYSCGGLAELASLDLHLLRFGNKCPVCFSPFNYYLLCPYGDPWYG
jgi:hypothetical protein